jgi:N-acetylmuramoyl-L-alanine amidase
MKARNIPTHEATFLNTGVDSLGKKFKLKKMKVDVPGETAKLTIIDCKRDNGDNSYFYKEVTPKDKIVLHFTAGYLKGDIATLTTPGNHVSVSYVIGRRGDIFRLFDDKYWSYHLGPGATGGNTQMSKSSIGIEISNIGYLKKIGNNLVSAYSNTDVYCTLADTTYYQTLNTPFRNEKYFASYTNEQYASLVKLLKHLTHKHPTVNRTLLDINKRYQYLTDPSQLKGIVSHINFRQSGKWDIGPGFDWSRVEAVVGQGVPV